jgi:hypothetical protein
MGQFYYYNPIGRSRCQRNVALPTMNFLRFTALPEFVFSDFCAFDLQYVEQPSASLDIQHCCVRLQPCVTILTDKVLCI